MDKQFLLDLTAHPASFSERLCGCPLHPMSLPSLIAAIPLKYVWRVQTPASSISALLKLYFFVNSWALPKFEEIDEISGVDNKVFIEGKRCCNIVIWIDNGKNSYGLFFIFFFKKKKHKTSVSNPSFHNTSRGTYPLSYIQLFIGDTYKVYLDMDPRPG